MSEPIPSLLDKLIDFGADGDLGYAAAADDERRVEALQRAVSRDLQYLLNARRAWRNIPKPLEATVMGYGLPDFTAGLYNSAEQRKELVRGIRAVVEAFEPRLDNVDVQLRQGPSDSDPVFHIVITGVLRGGVDAPQVTFETVVQAATMDVDVAQSHDG